MTKRTMFALVLFVAGLLAAPGAAEAGSFYVARYGPQIVNYCTYRERIIVTYDNRIVSDTGWVYGTFQRCRV